MDFVRTHKLLRDKVQMIWGVCQKSLWEISRRRWFFSTAKAFLLGNAAKEVIEAQLPVHQTAAVFVWQQAVGADKRQEYLFFGL